MDDIQEMIVKVGGYEHLSVLWKLYRVDHLILLEIIRVEATLAIRHNGHEFNNS